MSTPILLAIQQLDGGGSERQMRQLAVALNKLHYSVHVAFFRPDAARERELQGAGVGTIQIPLTSFASLTVLTLAAQLRSYLRTQRIRLVHTFDAPTATFVVPVARLSGTQVVLASQRGNRRLDPASTQKLRWLTDPLAHGVVVNAPALLEHLTHDAGIARDKLRFCPNGLDTLRFSPAGRHRPPELENAALVLGCVAAQRPEKQLPFLLDGFAELRRLRRGLKLVLVGSGTEHQKILERIEAHQMAADCLLIPHTPDTAGILRSIDIFQLTSSSEGQSNSLMEAMACGCAVVASNVEGTRDLVQHGTNGLLFEYGNQADFVAQTLSLIDEPARRLKIAQHSSDWVRTTMSMEAAAVQMASIYDEYLAR